ncbi:MAG TPA: cytochrome c peroxidase [Polyangia bacterium]
MALAITSALASGLACSQEGPLSDVEMDQLRTFTLPAQLPLDTSNAAGDDMMAVQLGKHFFFDTYFSGALQAPYNVAAGENGALGVAGEPGKVGCASCHNPMTAGVDRRSMPSATSLGASYTTRNAPSVINAAYSPVWQFWDGRVDSLWGQALGPPEGPVECNSSRLAVVRRIFDRYHDAYDAAFGGNYPLPAELADTTRFKPTGKPGDGGNYDNMPAADKEIVNRVYANFGKAIAAYERQLVSNNFNPSPFEAFMADPKGNPMSDAAIRGARLFVGHAGCAECHRGPMFTDYSFHNIGAPQIGEYVPAMDVGRASGADAVTGDEFNRRSLFSDDTTGTAYLDLQTPLDDTTRARLTGQFKTPSLRNVNKTAPYMHDGAYQTLWDVVNHYNFGGATGSYVGEKDPAIAPLMLSDAELSDLVEFLRALDDGDLSPYAPDPDLLKSPGDIPQP